MHMYMYHGKLQANGLWHNLLLVHSTGLLARMPDVLLASRQWLVPYKGGPSIDDSRHCTIYVYTWCACAHPASPLRCTPPYETLRRYTDVTPSSNVTRFSCSVLGYASVGTQVRPSTRVHKRPNSRGRRRSTCRDTNKDTTGPRASPNRIT